MAIDTVSFLFLIADVQMANFILDLGKDRNESYLNFVHCLLISFNGN